MLLAGAQRWTAFILVIELAVAAKGRLAIRDFLTSNRRHGTRTRRGAPLRRALELRVRDLRLAPNQNAHWRLTLKLAAAPRMERTQIGSTVNE